MTRLGVVVAFGGIVVLGGLVVDVARHPAVLRTPAAPVYAGILATVALGYGAATLLARRRSEGLGAIFAALVTALWMVELGAGNLAPPGLLTLLAYRLSTAGVLVATVAGGLLGGLRRGRAGDGVAVGAWSGMLSGMVVCLLAIGPGVLARHVGTTDPQALAQFRRSHASDLETFVVGDFLAAGTNHLWIGLGLGALLGLAGGLAGAAIAAGRAAGRRSRPT